MKFSFNNISELVSGRVTETRIAVAVFYLVGTAGMLIPFSFSLFKDLIPLALLLSAAVLVLFHEGNVYGKTVLFFIGIFILGFFVEVAGVNTGLIFGSYRYGDSLGKQWLNTPLMIGVNWCLLVYMSASVTRHLKMNRFLETPLAALLMLGYDVVLEQVAPKTDMWFWAENRVPLQNYAAWLVIALAFQAFLRIFRIPVRNKLALTILLVQFLFFSILTFLL